jgi:hypothetical protein
MSNESLKTEDLLGSRELRFLDRTESRYPNLMRMCMDFDFCVLQLQRRVYSHITNRYLTDSQSFVLVTNDYRTSNAAGITPVCNTLRKLEEYVTQHQVDILHDYLFGVTDDDVPSAG